MFSFNKVNLTNFIEMMLLYQVPLVVISIISTNLKVECLALDDTCMSGGGGRASVHAGKHTSGWSRTTGRPRPLDVHKEYFSDKDVEQQKYCNTLNMSEKQIQWCMLKVERKHTYPRQRSGGNAACVAFTEASRLVCRVSRAEGQKTHRIHESFNRRKCITCTYFFPNIFLSTITWII